MGVTSYLTVDGEILAETRDGVDRDYLPDPLGNVVALLDASQTRTDEAAYWPYGEDRARTGTTPTPFGYVGALGYHRDAPRRIYVRRRVLRPGLARWQTVDPLWPEESAYGYVEGNPASWVDKAGTASIPGRTTKGCTVSVCSNFGYSQYFLPTHMFVCVTGPYGGCAGGLYPTSTFGGAILDAGRNCESSGITHCEVVSTDCSLARAVCACIQAYRNDPGIYVPPSRTCYTFTREVLLSCACDFASITYQAKKDCLNYMDGLPMRK